MSAPSVTWYASGRRAVVDTADGEKWWIAPDGFGAYSAIRDDQQAVKTGGTLQGFLDELLGEQAAQFPPPQQ